MENEKDYIDKLYSEKLSKFESQISSDNWTQLSTKLGKTNFLKFSFTTFNAYFLGVIVSLASVVVYLGINNKNLSKKIEKLEDNVEIIEKQQIKNDIGPLLIDTIEVDEPQDMVRSKVAGSEIIESKSIKKIKEKIEQLPEQLKNDSINVKKDSLTVSKPDTSNIQLKKVIRRVKKKVFVKQDKVIIKDTVKIKKHK